MIGAIPKGVRVRLGWTTGSFALVQLLRLANNVILARLLAPPLFGLMLIVNSIRTGVELLSDVGINQNIISNRKGSAPDFYDTAWTIQVIRGIALAVLCFTLAGPFARFFEKPELAAILPVFALTFVFTGFHSASGALLQKQKLVGRISAFEVGLTVIAVLIQIGLALITPTIWALILGTIITGACAMVSSYLIMPGLRHRFMIDRESAREILVFGKWIFLSSIIYFFAMNFDRLYFAKQITLTLLGVYAIARSLADMLSQFAVRSSNMVLFPTVAAMEASPAEVRTKLLRARRTMMLLVACGLACFVAVSDVAVLLLYDARYSEAALLLPLLLLGVWISILATVNDSVLLGTAKPVFPAIAQGAKLLTFIVGVPLAFHYSGLIAAIVVLNAGEVVRYVVLWAFSRKQHLGFGRDDLALTLVFLVGVVVVREALTVLGLTSGIEELFPFLKTGFAPQ
jgi:O-antigen/teichoic acid export membrane protein